MRIRTPLVVQRAAQFGLAVDVDDVAVSRRDRRAHAHRVAEAVVSEVGDGEAVVRGDHQLRAGLAGGLGGDVGDLRIAGRELLADARRARAQFHDPCHRCPVEVRKAAVAGELCQELRVAQHAGVVPGGGVIEIGAHLEQPRHVVVERLQQQIASGRLVHGAGPQVPVVGGGRAVRRLLLDPPEQVVEARVVDGDDGRAQVGRVGDEDVDLVAPGAVSARRRR